ncbi:MAG: serine/threonine protein kinase, partial [Nannocystaceae bacterium]
MTTTGSTHSGALPQVEDLGARGYRVTGIVATDDSYLFATAIRETDNLAVMLKAPLSRNPSRVQLARIRHEFSMHRQFTHPSLAVALELAPCSNGLALVTAVNGTSLRALVATGSLELGVCLAVGIGVLKALECLHSGGYVHRDIKPASIHFDSNTQQVTLTNLALTAKITTLSHPENVRGKLCGSPHYLAPEQTGYMNRPVDHRADYYALGSTLYECMTGAPPFSGDLQETIYAHLARTPVPLDHALPDCPRAVVETINKLLCKEPNNRYQSPHGLRSDLEYCHALVTSRASDPSRPLTRPFVAGSEDVSTVLRIPNALFGRKQLLARLLEYFTTEATGVKHLFLSGPVGIGKSTLVGEMMPQVARSHALFGQGNCEPGQANIPYSVLLSALDTALRHAGKLARDEPTRMANALTFAPVLSDSLPALEELLGPLAPAPVLPIKEAGERFFAAMREVLRYLVSSCSRCVLIFED